MPGLAVILSPSEKNGNLSDIKRMVAAMRHEPFYTSGDWSDTRCGVYVGWTCLPGSYSDCMPIRSEDGNLVLFFYGEHLGNPARNNGSDNSATAVIKLIQQKGLSALSHLNGWYHGALVDLQQGSVTIFNDRYGMQRLFWAKDAQSTLFASEAKAILAVRPQFRKLDPKGLAEFLTCGCVLENRSIFSNIQTVPAATSKSFRWATAEKETQYFKAEEWESQSKLPEAEFFQAVSQTLPVAVGRCVRVHESVGMSLTGGFDTRLIMACLNSAKAKLPCYTFGGMYRDCFDVKIARKVADLCDCGHQVLPLDKGFLESFPKLAERTVYIADGTLGATNAYELHLNKLARRVATVRLTGSYGSEVMRGARAFKAIPPMHGLINDDYRTFVNDAVQTFDSISPGHPVSFSVFKQAPWYYGNRLAVEQSQVTVRTPFMDNDFVRLFYRRPETLRDSRLLARQLIAQQSSSLASLPTDTGNCSPLRHQWAQFLFKADYCYKSGMPQWLEKLHFLAGPLSPEKLLIGRHRFAHFRVWFRNQLSGYLREILLDSRTAQRPYFERKFVERMLEQHTKGQRNYTDEIERVLTLELTCRQFID